MQLAKNSPYSALLLHLGSTAYKKTVDSTFRHLLPGIGRDCIHVFRRLIQTKELHMKSISSIVSILTASLLLWACGNNTTPKRIVSEVPIKTEVLGLKLGDASSEKAVDRALSRATDKFFVTESQKNGIATVVRAIPTSLEIAYGGFSWHYVDVTLDNNMKIAQISIVASFENIERAKEQFDAARQVFTQKYGQGNINKEYQIVFWTDDTNSVGLFYMESRALNGDDRSYCTLYYVSRDLYNTLEEANIPDV